MKEAVSRKNEVQKAIYQNSTEENKRRYISMKNKANKAVSKAMRYKVEEALTELLNCQNLRFSLVRGPKNDSKEVESEMCMRGSDGKLCFSDNNNNGYF